MSDFKNDSPSINKSTPPPNNRKIRNPFDKALIDRLHKPICSPGMCKIYKKEQSGPFRWDIDQACTLVPADIVACNSQFEPSPDPALEKIAEEATEKFFSQAMVIPSPFVETSKKVKSLLHTSCDASIQIDSFEQEQRTIITSDVSAQTILTLPPELPPELEKILQPFFTYTQDQHISEEYENTANGSLRVKLFFEEHSDMAHYDSEHTDDEIQLEPRTPLDLESHTPVVVSPHLSRDLVAKGMKRTFVTPSKLLSTPCYRNKILDVLDFGDASSFSPTEFMTPKRTERILGGSGTSSSLASVSISPVAKAISSDEEKNNFTSPETEAMATCLDCVGTETDGEKKGPCFCKITPNKVALKRSKSLKESPPRSRTGSVSEKRSLSMSSLHRSRSVQKLNFSMDMSVDGSLHDTSQDSEYTSIQGRESTWSIVEENNLVHLVKAGAKSQKTGIRSSTKYQTVMLLDETPIKGKARDIARTHDISKIRVAMPLSPLEMSLDNSLDNSDNPLSLEDKKIDFNTVDLKFLTENVSQFDYTATASKAGDDVTTSFKKIDSGFNENTFYASSYYESAIKPSELTVTNISRCNKNPLKEISNVHWMRTDSGFKDENSTDSMHFYNANDTNVKKFTNYHFSEARVEDKENTEDFDNFLVDSSDRNDAMSMSDIFAEDMTFKGNFSSTPSKSKSRKGNS